MKKIIRFLKSILFPIECLGCGVADQWLCPACFSTIKLNPAERSGFPLSSSKAAVTVLVAADYNQPLLKKLLVTYKYRFVADVAECLGALLIDFLKNIDNNFTLDLVVPVPLASRRRRWRSFNQSALLAQRVSGGAGWPLNLTALIRKSYRHPQVGLPADRRRRNVIGAFAVADGSVVLGKKILLVDDVVTTGSTLAECANVLIAAGAREVWGLVIARG